MDSQLREHRELMEYLLESIAELREEMIQFRADRQICGRLNALALETPKVSESEQDDGQEIEELANWH